MSYKKIKATLEESLVEFFDYELHEDDFGVGITREIGQGEKTYAYYEPDSDGGYEFFAKKESDKDRQPFDDIDSALEHLRKQ